MLRLEEGAVHQHVGLVEQIARGRIGDALLQLLVAVARVRPPDTVTPCTSLLAAISATTSAMARTVPPAQGWLSGLWHPGQPCEQPCTNTA